jgi:23S rRNA (adenine2503-C2)-methyltransferase
MKILELTSKELTREIKRRYGKGEYYSRAIYREIYRNGNADFSRVKEFRDSKKLLCELQMSLKFNIGSVIREQKEKGLIKFITKLRDGLEIESVIIFMPTYKTVCVSSQVGCRMGCCFCATGKLGLLRNLTVEEIVGQLYTAKFFYGIDIRNVVFMGMGEPFDNFDNVIQAVRIISDPKGLNVPECRITISTAGRADGILKLAALNRQNLNLAISLNAPNNRIRSEIMPINRSVPMEKLKDVLLNYPLRKSGKFLIEYILIKDLNDSQRHALELAEFLKALRVKLNLIPYNQCSDLLFAPPSDERTHRFCRWLANEKLFVRMRSIRGQHMMAACGQLGKK